MALNDNGMSWNSIAKHLRDRHGVTEDALNEATYQQLDFAHKEIHAWLNKDEEK